MHKVDTAGSSSGMWVDKNPPTVPGTLMGKNWHNAVQQEIVQTIEAMGITIASSGAADASAGFHQLRQALFEKFLGADPRRFGAKGDGVTDDRAAFVSALAVSNVLLIPEGEFLISSTITIPEGAIIVGKGLNSKLKITANDNIFTVNDTSAILRDFAVNGNSTGTDQHLLRAEYDTETNKQLHMRNVFANALGGAMLDVDTTVEGNNLIVESCHVQFCSVGIRIGTALTDKGMKTIISNTVLRENDTALQIFGSDQRIVVGSSELYDGIIKLNGCGNVLFTDSSIDVDSYDPDNCVGVTFKDNSFPNTLSNTYPTDAGAKNSLVNFIRNTTKNTSGFWVPGCFGGTGWREENEFGFATMVQSTNTTSFSGGGITINSSVATVSGSQSIGILNGSTVANLFNTTTGKMKKTFGSGKVSVAVEVTVDVGGSGSVDDVVVSLLTSSSSSNGFRCSPSSDDLSSTEFVFSGNGVIELDEGDEIWVRVFNNSSSNSITVKTSASAGFLRANGL